MRFTNHFLILMVLNTTTLGQCFKGSDIFQRACRLVCSRTLRFTPKKSNEIFLNIIFLQAEIFSCLTFCHLTLLSEILYMVKLSNNAISVRQPQKSLACNFKCHCYYLQAAVCLLIFRLANFLLYFELLFSKFWYFEIYFLL